mgnify:FL=1
MLKREIAILIAIMLFMTLVACSNQPPAQPNPEFSDIVSSDTVDTTSGENNMEGSDGNNTDHSDEPTQNTTSSTATATEDAVTTEEKGAATDSNETLPKKETEQTEPLRDAEETAQSKTTESTKPVEETTAPPTEAPTEPAESTQPEKTTSAAPSSTYEIESMVAQYINQYRIAQGDSATTILPGLTEVARYRAKQLITDFSHNSNPNPCTVLQYGEYIDMTLFGGDAGESYYRGYNREAIGKGDWFGSADQIAQRTANGFKNSSSHWAYVGDSEYSYMAVGVIYNEADEKWYCCICMSSKKYGD